MEEEPKNKAEEPAVEFGKKKITFFNSFDEAEEFQLRKMAKRTHLERMQHLEILRKRANSDYLLPDGSWPPLAKTITIIYATFK